MDIRETCRSLAGGFVVYFAMASCSADQAADAPPGEFGGAVASATGGRSSNAVGGTSGESNAPCADGTNLLG